MPKMTFSKKILKLVCLLLLCMAHAGCAMLQIPFDLLGAVVGTAVGVGSSAVQLGIAAAPYAAPFFM
jgi:hypothetical protein